MLENLIRGPIFSSLNESQRLRVAQHAVNLHLDEGEILFDQGEPANRFYLVLAGQMKLYSLSESGREKVFEIIKPGHTFGEALMFMKRPAYPVGAQALQPANLVSIDAVDFRNMLHESVDTCFLLLADLSDRLRAMVQEVESLSLNSATCRVARYLLLNSAPDVFEIDLEVPKQVLASQLSIKPETFSRVVRELSDTGILAIKGGHVHILDRHQLEEVARACNLPSEVINHGA